jgi:hypothetical protein
MAAADSRTARNGWIGLLQHLDPEPAPVPYRPGKCSHGDSRDCSVAHLIGDTTIGRAVVVDLQRDIGVIFADAAVNARRSRGIETIALYANGGA